MMKKNRMVNALLVMAVWGVLVLFAWFSPAKELSQAERRPLAQRPQLTAEKLLGGKFMSEFEKYTLDQFPLRDGFRTLKSLFHYKILGQKDNNGIYLHQGYAAMQENRLDPDSVDHALDRFSRVYEKYLLEPGGSVVFALVPDKGQYLAPLSGNLSVPYDQMAELFRTGMPWADHVSLLDTLALEDYYTTDTHWRQENLLEAASALCAALDAQPPQPDALTPQALDRPFYGVYYGQAALPMEPEEMIILRSEALDQCRVYDYESGTYTPIYNLELLSGRDMYDVFLSGSRSLLTIENPSASTDRELIIFRDSFGSAIAPLLLESYARVTLVDIRYVPWQTLDRYIDFHGQDTLFLYSTLVLNNSQTIK